MTQTQSSKPTTQASGVTPPPASQVDGARLTDALFGAPLEPDKPAPTVNPEDLALGAVVRKQGERVISFTREGRPRKATIHIFANLANPERWFSLFGSSNLDSQLRKVRQGAAILLRYSGKRALDDDSGREVHTWEVRQTQANPAQIAQLLGTAEWGPKLQALDLAITQAQQREQERRAAGGSSEPEPPPHTDNDAPVTWARP